MRMVMVVFTALAMSLGACNVEGPGSGEAKSEPPASGDDQNSNKWTKSWFAGARNGDELKQFVFAIDHDNNLSIQAVEVANPDETSVDEIDYKPMEGEAGCINRFTDLQRSGDSYPITYSKRQGGKYISITIIDHDIRGVNLDELTYSFLNSEGKTVTYHRKEKPVFDTSISEAELNQYGLLEEAEDCDHVSQSGEEGSGAPGGG